MANKKPSALTAAAALDGTELFHAVQAGNSRKVTGNQIRTLALAPFGANGLAARTGTETFAARTLTGPAAGISVSNGDGVAGNPTLALANDLAALEALGSTGLAVRTAPDAWTQRTLQAPAAGLTIGNPAGVAGDPTFALANDLAALEALSGTNTLYYRSAADTWTAVTIGGNLQFSGGVLNYRHRGCLVKKAADQTGANFTSITALTWDSETGGYDTDNIHDNSASPSRLTVPAGVGKVKLIGKVAVTSLTADNWGGIFVYKNGASGYVGYPGQMAESSNPGAHLIVTTPVLAVSPSDYFELMLLVESDTSVSIEEESSWFAMEIIE